jgi:hypothetical protein
MEDLPQQPFLHCLTVAARNFHTCKPPNMSQEWKRNPKDRLKATTFPAEFIGKLKRSNCNIQDSFLVPVNNKEGLYTRFRM